MNPYIYISKENLSMAITKALAETKNTHREPLYAIMKQIEKYNEEIPMEESPKETWTSEFEREPNFYNYGDMRLDESEREMEKINQHYDLQNQPNGDEAGQFRI